MRFKCLIAVALHFLANNQIAHAFAKPNVSFSINSEHVPHNDDRTSIPVYFAHGHIDLNSANCHEALDAAVGEIRTLAQGGAEEPVFLSVGALNCSKDPASVHVSIEYLLTLETLRNESGSDKISLIEGATLFGNPVKLEPAIVTASINLRRGMTDERLQPLPLGNDLFDPRLNLRFANLGEYFSYFNERFSAFPTRKPDTYLELINSLYGKQFASVEEMLLGHINLATIAPLVLVSSLKGSEVLEAFPVPADHASSAGTGTAKGVTNSGRSLKILLDCRVPENPQSTCSNM